MEKIIIVVISVLVLVILYKAYTLNFGKIKIFTISSFFIFSYIAFAYLGSILLNLFEFQMEINLGLYNRRDILFLQWELTTYSLIFVFIGIYITKHIWSNFDLRLVYYKAVTKKISFYPSLASNYSFVIFLTIFLLSILTLIIYRSKLGQLPIEMILSGNVEDKALSLVRSDATNSFSRKLYRYFLFIEGIPMLIFIVISFIKDIGKKQWVYLYIFLFTYNAFVSIMTLEKAPLLKFLILCVIIYFFKRKEISIKLLLKLGLFFTPLIVLMYFQFMGQDSLSFIKIIEIASHRIFIGSIEPLFWYIKYVDEYGLLYGLSFPNPAGIFSFEHFPLTVEISKYAGYTIAGTGIIGSMPTVFLGEWYVNFGLVGVMIGSVIFGFIIQTTEFFILVKMAKNKSIFIVSIFIYYIQYFSQFAETSMSIIFFDPKFYLPIIVSIFLKSLILKKSYGLQ